MTVAIMLISPMLYADEKFVVKIVEYFKAWEYFLLKPSWSYWLFGAFNKHIAAVYVSINDE